MIRSLTLALIAAVAVFAHSHQAAAHSYHTPNTCSPTAPEICAHIGSANEPNSKDEFNFMLHFMPKGVNAKLITNINVKLWMDSMGHGSAPVTIAPVDEIHFEVTGGYFPMSGPWQIKVSFAYAGANHELVVPVDVK